MDAALVLLSEASKIDLVALDVGANVGDWAAALHSAAPNATIYCFEPSSTAFSALTQRFPDGDSVRLIKSAVGAQAGVASLWADKPGSGPGSLSRRHLEHLGISFNYSEEVDIITLDAWQRQQCLAPVLLKMDVEDHELSVLKGAAALLESIEVIQLEMGGCNIDTRTYLRDFFDFLVSRGFDLFRLGLKGLLRLKRYAEFDEFFETTNDFAQRP